MTRFDGDPPAHRGGKNQNSLNRSYRATVSVRRGGNTVRSGKKKWEKEVGESHRLSIICRKKSAPWSRIKELKKERAGLTPGDL